MAQGDGVKKGSMWGPFFASATPFSGYAAGRARLTRRLHSAGMFILGPPGAPGR